MARGGGELGALVLLSQIAARRGRSAARPPLTHRRRAPDAAMGQNPGSPTVNPTKIGSKMGGEFTHPKMVPLVLTHSHIAQP